MSREGVPIEARVKTASIIIVGGIALTGLSSDSPHYEAAPTSVAPGTGDGTDKPKLHLADTGAAGKPFIFGVTGDFNSDIGPAASAFTQNDESAFRIDAGWATAAPNPPVTDADGAVSYSWNWAPLDSVVTKLAEKGLRPQPVLDYGTLWGTEDGSQFGVPSRTAVPHFKAYARAYAERFGTDGTFWQANPQLPYLPVKTIEIGNEPNLSLFFQSGGQVPNAKVFYERYFKPGSKGIREVQPDMRIILGGLAYFGPHTPSNTYTPPRRWLDQLSSKMLTYIAKQGDEMAIGLHPYDTEPVAGIIDFRSVMNKRELEDTPIAITEMGISEGTAKTPAYYAQQLLRVAKLATSKACNIMQIIPYPFQSNDVSHPTSGTNIDKFFSLVDPTGQLTDAGHKVLEGLKRLKPNKKACTK